MTSRITLILTFCLFFGTSHILAQGDSTVHKPQYFFIKLNGTRPGWPNDMTQHEQQVMADHFDFLKDLIARKLFVTAGPVLSEPPFGLGIIRARSLEDAKKIMADEPSVKSGVMTYEIYPMVLSLLEQHDNPDRYPAEQSDRRLVKEAVVTASLEDVWKSWTTTEGVNKFFSENANVKLVVGGPYEIYFNMKAPEGERGSEECKILSYLPMEMLSFEWNAPPQFGALRYVYTRIVLQFFEEPGGKVRVRLTHLGWGKGADWDKIYDYFNNAWGYVLKSFEESFAKK